MGVDTIFKEGGGGLKLGDKCAHGTQNFYPILYPEP